MNSVKCCYCNKLIFSNRINNHIKACKFIYENKEYLISRYNETNNLYKIACEEHITYSNLSFAFKSWGVKLNIDDDGDAERKYEINDDFFDDMFESQYWLVGLLASDGSKSKYNQISLAQSGDEGLELIKYVNELLSSNYPITVTKTSCKDSFSIMFSSKKIVRKLEKYNIVKNKTYSYTMPNIPDEYFNAFLLGYIEGDGCITISDNGNGCKYLNASFVGTKAFIEACEKRIPIKASVRKHSSSMVYEIRWYGENAIHFCDWLYSYKNLYHSYKYKNYEKAKKAFKNTRKERYKEVKNKVLNDFKNGQVISVMEYSKSINLPFQTIYSWRNKWITEGLL